VTVPDPSGSAANEIANFRLVIMGRSQKLCESEFSRLHGDWTVARDDTKDQYRFPL
jgi:hypothetical protein